MGKEQCRWCQKAWVLLLNKLQIQPMVTDCSDPDFTLSKHIANIEDIAVNKIELVQECACGWGHTGVYASWAGHVNSHGPLISKMKSLIIKWIKIILNFSYLKKYMVKVFLGFSFYELHLFLHFLNFYKIYILNNYTCL